MSIAQNSAKKELPSFNPYSTVVVSFLEAELTKFNIVRSYDRNKQQIYSVCYEDKPLVLKVDTPSDDLRGEQRFTTFGLKKTMTWDDKIKKFNDEWTGEYDMGIKLINNVDQSGTNVWNSASPTEKKLYDVLCAIKESIRAGLVAFDELSEVTSYSMVPDLFNRTSLKDKAGLVVKKAGSILYDETKSPVWNLKCKSGLIPGVKFEKGKQPLAHERTLTTEFHKPGYGDVLFQADELLGKPGKGIYWITFGKINSSKKGWSPRSTLNSAVISPMQKQVQDFGEKLYAQKYFNVDEEQTEEMQEF